MPASNRLREERLARGLYQWQLARMAGVSLRTITNAEAGGLVRFDTQRKLLRVLKIEWQDRAMVFGAQSDAQGVEDAVRLSKGA